jgi:heat shock protein HtpX
MRGEGRAYHGPEPVMSKTSTPRDPMSVGGLELAGQVEANRRRAALVVAGFGVAAGLVVAVVLALITAWPLGLGLGLAAGILVAWGVLVRAAPRAVRLAGGVPVDPAVHARLINVVEGLALAAGVPPPELFVIDSPARNALTVGLDARHARLVVTGGLLERLSRIELEGVVAHELSHIRAGDIRTATIGVGALGPLTFLGGAVDRVMRWLVGPQRETLADLRAASLTRYPPGLASALEAMAEPAPGTPDGVPDVFGPLWSAPPESVSGRGPFAPPLVSRIEALREL